MLQKSISNLSIEQLKTLVFSMVDERLTQYKVIQETPNQQQLKEIFDSIDSHIWNPPSSAPSTLQLLQEDRHQ
jgi:hypothetical protein